MNRTCAEVFFEVKWLQVQCAAVVAIRKGNTHLYTFTHVYKLLKLLSFIFIRYL